MTVKKYIVYRSLSSSGVDYRVATNAKDRDVIKGARRIGTIIAPSKANASTILGRVLRNVSSPTESNVRRYLETRL